MPDNKYLIDNKLTVSDIFGGQEDRINALFPAARKEAQNVARDQFLIYCLGEQNMSIDEIAAMSPEDKHALGDKFLREVWGHPVFGSAVKDLPKAKQTVKDNAKWYGEMYKKALKKIQAEKVPMPSEKDFSDPVALKAVTEGKFGFVAQLANHYNTYVKENLLTYSTNVTEMNPLGISIKVPFRSGLVTRDREDIYQNMFGNILAYDDIAKSATRGPVQQRAYFKLVGELDTTHALPDEEDIYSYSKNPVKTSTDNAIHYDWATNFVLTDAECEKILNTPFETIQKEDSDLYMKALFCFNTDDASPVLRLRYRKEEDRMIAENAVNKNGFTAPGDLALLTALAGARYNSKGVISPDVDKAFRAFINTDQSDARTRRRSLEKLNKEIRSVGDTPGRTAAKEALIAEYDRVDKIIDEEVDQKCAAGLDFIDSSEFLPQGWIESNEGKGILQKAGIDGPYDKAKMNALLLTYMLGRHGTSLNKIAELTKDEKEHIGQRFVEDMKDSPVRGVDNTQQREMNLRWHARTCGNALGRLTDYERNMRFPEDPQALNDPEKVKALKASGLYLAGKIAGTILPIMNGYMAPKEDEYNENYVYGDADQFKGELGYESSAPAIVHTLGLMSAYSEALDDPKKAPTIMPKVAGKRVVSLQKDKDLGAGPALDAYGRQGEEGVAQLARSHRKEVDKALKLVIDNDFHSKLHDTAAANRQTAQNFKPETLSEKDLDFCVERFDHIFGRLAEAEAPYLSGRKNPSITANFKIGGKSAWDLAMEHMNWIEAPAELTEEQEKTVESYAKALILNGWIHRPEGISYDIAMPNVDGVKLPEDVTALYPIPQEARMKEILREEEEDRQRAIRNEERRKQQEREDEQRKIREEQERRNREKEEQERQEQERIERELIEAEKEKKRGPSRNAYRQRARAINGKKNLNVLNLRINKPELREGKFAYDSLNLGNVKQADIAEMNTAFDQIFGDLVRYQHQQRYGNVEMTAESEAEIIADCFKIKNSKDGDKEVSVRDLAAEKVRDANTTFGTKYQAPDYYKTFVMHAMARDFCDLKFYPFLQETGSKKWIQDDQPIVFNTAGKTGPVRNQQAPPRRPVQPQPVQFDPNQNLQHVQPAQPHGQQNRNGRTYDQYLALHTGERATNGDNEKLVENAAKALTVIRLSKVDTNRQHEGDVVNFVHKNMKDTKRTYCLDLLTDQDLKAVIESPASARRYQEGAMKAFYGVKEENWATYKADLKKIYDNMLPEDGRTEKYKNLRAAMKNVFEIPTPPNLSEDQKQEIAGKIQKRTAQLVTAIEDYTKGKKKVRWNQYGKLAFNQTMDALAVVKRNAGNQLNARIKVQVDRINTVRGVDANSPDFVDLNKFGAQQSETRRQEYDAARGVQQNQNPAPQRGGQGPGLGN